MRQRARIRQEESEGSRTSDVACFSLTSARAARGIRINAICPGLGWTPMADQMVAAGQGDALKAMEKSVPMGRVGRPEEIANAVLWLCSDAASCVTGQSISVDGGFVMH